MHPNADRTGSDPRPALLLSFDFEDWSQLIGRDLGLDGWDRRSHAFERQMHTLLGLLDDLGVKATFFVLGISARLYPELVQELSARGHEIACHGYAHVRAFRQTRDTFFRDVERAAEMIEQLVGSRPRGYRAPWFSINRDALWAYEVLRQLGFKYDSSQYDSPLVPRRIRGIPDDSYRLVLPSGGELAEFPVAVWRRGRLSIPVGGGSYWRLLPTRFLLRTLHNSASARDHVALYFHPHELDPDPLSVPLAGDASASQQTRALYNRLYADVRRRSITSQLRSVAREFRLLTYGELCPNDALQSIRSGGHTTRSRALSAEGIVV
jgi:polysaccharide deacetylase family protein (PEP-CTERM system associated)